MAEFNLTNKIRATTMKGRPPINPVIVGPITWLIPTLATKRGSAAPALIAEWSMAAGITELILMVKYPIIIPIETQKRTIIKIPR